MQLWEVVLLGYGILKQLLRHIINKGSGVSMQHGSTLVAKSMFVGSLLKNSSYWMDIFQLWACADLAGFEHKSDI